MTKDFESAMTATRPASQAQPATAIQVEPEVPPSAQSVKLESNPKQPTWWSKLPLWKRRTFIALVCLVLFLIILVAILYGVVYVLIRNSFNGSKDFPQFLLSNLTEGNISTTLVQKYQLKSSLPLILHDFNLTYATEQGPFAVLQMPGYYIANRYLNMTRNSTLVITNETILGKFGNQALSVLTSNNDDIVSYKIFLSSDMSVNCGIPGFTFIHWIIPYRAQLPFQLTSLGNLGALSTASANSEKVQEDSQAMTDSSTPPPPAPASDKKASVSRVRLRIPRFWIKATVNFTNPAPLAMDLDLVKGQIYSYNTRLAEVFIEDFNLLQGNNSIVLTFWLNDFKGAIRTAINTVFNGIKLHQFSLRNITVAGSNGNVKWINEWFHNITISLPHVKHSGPPTIEQKRGNNSQPTSN